MVMHGSTMIESEQFRQVSNESTVSLFQDHLWSAENHSVHFMGLALGSRDPHGFPFSGINHLERNPLSTRLSRWIKQKWSQIMIVCHFSPRLRTVSPPKKNVPPARRQRKTQWCRVQLWRHHSKWVPRRGPNPHETLVTDGRKCLVMFNLFGGRRFHIGQ